MPKQVIDAQFSRVEFSVIQGGVSSSIAVTTHRASSPDHRPGVTVIGTVYQRASLPPGYVVTAMLLGTAH